MRRNILFLALSFVTTLSCADTLAPVTTATPGPATATPAPMPAPTTPAPAAAAPTAPLAPIAPAPQKPIVNEVQVSVTDEGPAALQLGLQAAFSEVMLKMTGDPKVMTLPAVQTVNGNLTQIVQSYSYVQQKTATIPPSKPTLTLDVVFDSNALQQLLQIINKPADTTTTQQPVTSQVKLLVTGIKNMEDYNAMVQSLRGTPNVNSVTVNSIDPDRVALTLDVNGGSAQLKTGLTSNAHFKPLVANTAANETELLYLWTDQP